MKKAAQFLLTFACVMLCSYGVKAEVFDIIGTNVNYPSQEQIVQYYEDSAKSSLSTKVSYDSEPNFSGSTYSSSSSGVLSDKTQEAALDVLNYVRYIAGISYDITLAEERHASIQAGTFLNALNDSLSHYPTQPVGVTNTLYDLGYEGTTSSNLGMGYSDLGTSITQGWMEDGDTSNIDRAGHRRWILNPTMAETAFGFTSHNHNFSAMYAINGAGKSTDITGVSWPAQNMPVDLFGSIYPWTFSVGEEISGTVRVTLTRLNDDTTWKFSSSDTDTSGEYFNVENTGYGQKGCIIFRPDPSEISYSHGDMFHVEISGAVEASYCVTFFDVTKVEAETGSLKPSSTPDSVDLSPTISVTGVSLNKTSLTVEEGKRSTLTATVSPEGAEEDVSWSSSNTAVATVSSTGRVVGISEGTATVTVTTDSGGKTATCAVTVIAAEEEDEPEEELEEDEPEEELEEDEPEEEPEEDTEDKLEEDSDTEDNQLYRILALVVSDDGTYQGGSVYLSESSASEGTEITAYLTIEEGYFLDKVTILDDTGKELSFRYRNATQTLLFSMGNRSVTMRIYLKAPQLPEVTPEWVNPFLDVRKTDWYYDSVAFVHESGLMSGMLEGYFSPADMANRGMIVTILHNYAQNPTAKTTASYIDVTTGDYFYKAVSWATEHGIVSGTGDGAFSPWLDVTREQFVCMLYNYHRSRGGEADGDYALLFQEKDAFNVNTWAFDGMAWALTHGIVSGREDGYLMPLEPASRSEIAAMLRHYHNAFG